MELLQSCLMVCIHCKSGEQVAEHSPPKQLRTLKHPPVLIAGFAFHDSSYFPFGQAGSLSCPLVFFTKINLVK
jgi:hypothetical protein